MKIDFYHYSKIFISAYKNKFTIKPYFIFSVFGGITKVNDYVPTPLTLPCLKADCLDCTREDHK